jgi:alcohol dehydrogenase
VVVSRRAEALVLNGPESFERRWLDIPVTADEASLLRVEACGLYGTDHEQYSGHIRSRFPFVPGHEIGEAARRWGVAVGDRVAVEVFKSCRDCDQCRCGLYRRCVRNGLRTMFGFVDVDHEHGLWGGYSTHLVLDRDAMLLPVPEGLDPVLAPAFNPIGAGIRWGATLPQTGPDAVVAVLGPGIRGLGRCRRQRGRGRLRRHDRSRPA